MGTFLLFSISKQSFLEKFLEILIKFSLDRCFPQRKTFSPFLFTITDNKFLFFKSKFTKGIKNLNFLFFVNLPMQIPKEPNFFFEKLVALT
mmetsp:Transcript_11537/g.28781  ORF Transcript_11537/g.28781 Transcript_11537/m.28781 type:complete len:91 (-) Transcript_11537:80-352(-)